MNTSEIHPSAHALTLFRVLNNGAGRAYTAVTFPQDPWQGCERTIRMGKAVGWVKDPTDDAYGVLDVLNEDGDIVQDFSVPTARAFQCLKRRLDLRVEMTDAR
jgi:hypothetical protein